MKAAYGRIRIIGPGGEFVKLTEAEQRAIDSVSSKERAKTKSKGNHKTRQPKLPRGRISGYREFDYRSKK